MCNENVATRLPEFKNLKYVNIIKVIYVGGESFEEDAAMDFVFAVSKGSVKKCVFYR